MAGLLDWVFSFLLLEDTGFPHPRGRETGMCVYVIQVDLLAWLFPLQRPM